MRGRSANRWGRRRRAGAGALPRSVPHPGEEVNNPTTEGPEVRSLGCPTAAVSETRIEVGDLTSNYHGSDL